MKKVRIVACDSNNEEREFYMQLCREIGAEQDVEVKIKPYSSGQALLFDLSDPSFMETIDVLQLEIDLHDADGVQIAHQARALGYNGLILFLTRSADNEHYEKAFDADAANYVRKGHEHLERLHQVLSKTIDAAKKFRQEYILLRCAGERRRIDLAQIKYFESMRYRMVAYYGDERFEFISSMGKLEVELLGRGFARIHRAYMVSLEHVQSYTYTSVTLFDKTVLPIGRTYAASFRTAIERWRQ